MYRKYGFTEVIFDGEDEDGEDEDGEDEDGEYFKLMKRIKTVIADGGRLPSAIAI